MRSTATLLVFFLLAAGCGAPASIVMKDGRVVEAVIVGGDEKSIFIETDSFHSEAFVPRQDVEDIDHPGDAMVIAAVPFYLVGLGLTALGLSNELSDQEDATGKKNGYLIGGSIIAALATAPMIKGFVDWSQSKAAASPPVDVQVAPVALTDGERTYYGFEAGWRF